MDVECYADGKHMHVQLESKSNSGVCIYVSFYGNSE